MNKERILSILFCVCFVAVIIFAFAVGVNDCKSGTGAFAKSEDVYPVTAARMSAKNAVYFDFETSGEYFINLETEAPETSQIESVAESEEDSEQEASEEDTSVCTISSEVACEEDETDTLETLVARNTSASVEKQTKTLQVRTEVETEVESASGVTESGVRYYGIWTGDYWHFTPEQIDAQWRGLKTSKPSLPQGTTRAWQSYLYDRLAGIGAEWFYKYAVAQAMQESGMNPLNQQGNDAVPDKGLFSFRIYYWNSAYGDVFDYHANINAYVDRIAPYLTDSSEAGIYRAISQHYQPNGQTNMTYVNQVLGRLNELWEVE